MQNKNSGRSFRIISWFGINHFSFSIASALESKDSEYISVQGLYGLVDLTFPEL